MRNNTMQKFQLRTPINKKRNKFFVLLKKNRSNGMKLRKLRQNTLVGSQIDV